MKKTLIAALAVFSFNSGALHAADSDIPNFVTNAKDDFESALIANVFKRPDFKCHALQAEDKTWTMGCFLQQKNPIPFLLFTVTPDPDKSNPPFDYKVHALNGKAKQYAKNEALRMFKVDEVFNNKIDIGKTQDAYVSKFVD